MTGIVNDPSIKPVHERRVPHTPGPWRVFDSGEVFGVCKGYGNQADLFHGAEEYVRCHAEDMANMRIASLAPEMYTVLKSMGEMLRILDPNGNVGVDMSPAQARLIIDLIDRAEGVR